MHNFESVIQSQIFSKWQRGFTKASSTIHNIEDILKYARELQLTKKIWTTSTATVVFFDFEKAYDNVPRDLLIEKLQQMNIPCNITNLIYNMLRKFKLNFNGETIHTNKGLVQGSVLSIILFNLFINDLIILLKINGTMVRAYADDIAWVWTSIYQTRRAVEIMENWSTINKMKINPTKSGIIRILLRKGKIKQISN